jgi:LysR family transcriptional regulator, glycine cleavage system transcriptional activator
VRTSARRLPPLDSLRAYEAVARHRSFTKAAHELHVTQSAVSQRIRALELELAAPLFRRTTRGLEPTDEGAALAVAVRRGLAEIAAALTTFDAGSGNALTVSVLPSFATRWLVPRLAGLLERHPEIEVQIKADGHLADLHSGEADLGIRFGLGRYPGLRCDLLMGDATQPVVSPRLLQQRGPLDGPSAIADLKLLHDSTAVAADGSGSDWTSWFAQIGRPDMPCDDGLRFSNAVLAIEAAAAGLGVALARMSLIGDDLVSGRLVAPFPPAIPTTFSYWLVSRPEMAEKPRIAAFRLWLLEEASSMRDHEAESCCVVQ